MSLGQPNASYPFDPNDPNALNEVLLGNCVHVMVNLGDDATGVRNRLDLPFKTLFAAKSVAVAGDTVVVWPGSYPTSADLMVDGVNWWFVEGAEVSITGPTLNTIFDDKGAKVVCNIIGGRFFTISINAPFGGHLKTTHPDSIVQFHPLAQFAVNSDACLVEVSEGTHVYSCEWFQGCWDISGGAFMEAVFNKFSNPVYLEGVAGIFNSSSENVSISVNMILRSSIYMTGSGETSLSINSAEEGDVSTFASTSGVEINRISDSFIEMSGVGTDASLTINRSFNTNVFTIDALATIHLNDHRSSRLTFQGASLVFIHTEFWSGNTSVENMGACADTSTVYHTFNRIICVGKVGGLLRGHYQVFGGGLWLKGNRMTSSEDRPLVFSSTTVDNVVVLEGFYQNTNAGTKGFIYENAVGVSQNAPGGVWFKNFVGRVNGVATLNKNSAVNVDARYMNANFNKVEGAAITALVGAPVVNVNV